MSVGDWVHLFFADTRVQIILLAVILDLVLGIAAAAISKQQSFRLNYVADVLRTDVLAKLLPFFVVYGGYLYARNTDILIPGLDLEVVMNSAFVLISGALVASIIGSLTDLGIWKSAPENIAGGDPNTPTPLPPVK